MQPKSTRKLLQSMKRGRVYRRDELRAFSRAVDRDLKRLTEDGSVHKAGAGLYYLPQASLYGPLPADDRELVRVFLGDDNFLLVSSNLYNGLGLGLTQAYNVTRVYNRKRHVDVTLDGRRFEFRRPKDFPRRLSLEFLLVDLLDNLHRLSEDTSHVLELAKKKAAELDRKALLKAAACYGKLRTRRLVESIQTNA